ncbi:MAG: 5-formyltetrahydrofolate cyclo-ligase [Christensenellaceae bacterium]|jgi:5-formyltetrahydrofolate cyclo-ligase
MEKEKLRELLLVKRRELTSKYIDDASGRIYERTIALKEVIDAKNVLIYSNFDNEVKTGNLTGWLLFKGKTVALPVVQENDMLAVNIKSAPLEMSGFGVAQPKLDAAEIVAPDTLDIIIVPGIGFDRNKNRLGFGRGYYDIFLKRAPKAKKIALAYDFQIADEIEAASHDVKMDMIITPDEIIK